ncbi:MAG TPA: ParB-like nuclease domain-containing protein [Candidatus Scybalomonas excrementigallinarum]|nr:ParB-like nuclease domain-containing protein [Candidatus Scybalomonas excrementigallinarum]
MNINRINELLEELKYELNSIESLEEKIETLNHCRKELHDISPFKEEPVDCVLWIKDSCIQANEYNPNHVATPEMHLLHTSIKEDGYTMPIVTYDMQNGSREIVDGFHRNRVEREYKDINKRLMGYLPVTTLDKPLEDRIASTIRHNRARGTHGIRPMSDIVLDLSRAGWNDTEICQKLGMDLDEVIRLKQITGLKEAFSSHEFSKSWEEFESKYYNEDQK